MINTFCPNCGTKMQTRVIWAHPQSTVFCECPKCHTKTKNGAKTVETPEINMKTPEKRTKP